MWYMPCPQPPSLAAERSCQRPDKLGGMQCNAGGKPKPLQSHAAALPQRSTPQQRPQPQQPSKPVNAVAIANFGLSLAPAAAPATSIVPTQVRAV